MLLAFIAAAIVAASPSPATPAATPTAIATSQPSPPATQPPHAHAWQGVTPGETVSHLHATLGAPLLVRLRSDGSTLDWYQGPNDNAYVMVGERNNIVTFVRAFAIVLDGPLNGLTDPYGVAPGDNIAKLTKLRGNPKEGRRLSPIAVMVVYDDGAGMLSLYEFANDVIHAITLFDSRAPGQPPTGSQYVSDPHDGASIGRAYVIHARNEREGIRFETYYATHRGGCSQWKIANQTLLTLGKHEYDQLDLECVDDKSQTSMFFDVTSFFGKT